jgi:hypothetical protein
MDGGALLPTARDRLSSTMPARVPIGVIPSTSSHHVRCRTITQRQDERSRAVPAILPHLATTLACMPSPSPAPCIFQICSTSVPNRNLIRHCRKAITACKFLQPFRRLLQTRISPLPCHLKLPASRPAQSACSMPRDDNRSARCHGDWPPAKT